MALYSLDRPAAADDQFSGALRRYPGAKAGAGVYQSIINEIPPHRVYVEPFVGSGQIFLRKKTASCSIVADADETVVEHWRAFARGVAAVTVEHADARSLIGRLAGNVDREWLFYCDPPYVGSARRSQRAIYRHELKTETEHAALLAQLVALPALVMLSGYRSGLYDDALRDWRRVDIPARTRGGPAVESLWCNFPRPVALHDASYLGANYRQRQDVKRKRARWARRLAAMPPQERRALLEELVLLELASAGVPLLEAKAFIGKRADAAGAGILAALLPLRDLASAGAPAVHGGAAGASRVRSSPAAVPLVDVACASVASRSA